MVGWIVLLLSSIPSSIADCSAGLHCGTSGMGPPGVGYFFLSSSGHNSHSVSQEPFVVSSVFCLHRRNQQKKKHLPLHSLHLGYVGSEVLPYVPGGVPLQSLQCLQVTSLFPHVAPGAKRFTKPPGCPRLANDLAAGVSYTNLTPPRCCCHRCRSPRRSLLTSVIGIPLGPVPSSFPLEGPIPCARLTPWYPGQPAVGSTSGLAPMSSPMSINSTSSFFRFQSSNVSNWVATYHRRCDY